MATITLAKYQHDIAEKQKAYNDLYEKVAERDGDIEAQRIQIQELQTGTRELLQWKKDHLADVGQHQSQIAELEHQLKILQSGNSEVQTSWSEERLQLAQEHQRLKDEKARAFQDVERLEREIHDVRTQLVASQKHVESLESDCVSRKEDFDELEEDTHVVHEFFQSISDRFAPVLKELGQDATPENLRNHICGLGVNPPSLPRRGSANSFDSMISRDFPNASIDGKGYRQASIGDELARHGSDHGYDSLDHKFGDERDLLFEDSMLDLESYELDNSDDEAASLRAQKYQPAQRRYSRDSVFSNGDGIPLPKVRGRKGVSATNGVRDSSHDRKVRYQSTGTQCDYEQIPPITPIETPTRSDSASVREHELSKLQQQKVQQLQAEIKAFKHQQALRHQNVREISVMTDIEMSQLSDRAGHDLKDAQTAISDLRGRLSELQTKHDEAQETIKHVEAGSRSIHSQMKILETRHAELTSSNGLLETQCKELESGVATLEARNRALEDERAQASLTQQAMSSKIETIESDLAKQASDLGLAENSVRQWKLKHEQIVSECEDTRRVVNDLQASNDDALQISDALRQQIAALEAEKKEAAKTQKLYQVLSDEHKALREKTGALERSLEDNVHVQEECVRHRKTIDALDFELAKFKDLNARYEALQTEKADLLTAKRAYFELQAEHKTLASEMTTLRSELEEKSRLQARSQELDEQIRQLQKREEDVLGELQEARLEKVQAQIQLEKSSNEQSILETERIEHDRGVMTQITNFQETIAALQKVVSEMDALKASHAALSESNDALQADKIKSQDMLKSLETELSVSQGVGAMNIELQANVDSLRKDLDALGAEKISLKSQFDTLRQSHEELMDVRDQNKIMRERLESLEATSEINSILQDQLDEMHAKNEESIAASETLKQQLNEVQLKYARSSTRVHDLVKEVQELRAKDAEDANLTRQLRDQLNVHKIREDAQTANAQALQERLDTLQATATERAKELQSVYDQLETAKSAEEASKTQVHSLRNQLEAFRTEHSKCKKAIEEFTDELQIAQREKAQLQVVEQNNASLHTKIEGLLIVEAKSMEMQSRIERLQTDLADLHKTREENAGFLNTIRQLQAQAADSQSLQADCQSLQQRNEGLMLQIATIQAVETRNADLKRNIAALKDEIIRLESTQADNVELKSKYNELEQTVASLRMAADELAELQVKYDGIQSESGELLSQHQSLKAKYDELEDENYSQTLEIRKLKLAKPDTSNLESQIEEQEKTHVELQARIAEAETLNEYQADEIRKLRHYAEQSESEDKALIIKLDTEIKYLNGKTVQLETDKRLLKTQALQSKLPEPTRAAASFFRDRGQGSMCIAARQRSPLHQFLDSPWWLQAIVGLMFVMWASMTFAAYSERKMWLSANDDTHRHLRNIMARRASYTASCSGSSLFWEILFDPLSYFD
jgi:chromosome segregation ATPase